MNEKKESVITANEDFYRAFDSSDMVLMESLWSAKHEVSVVHPGWDLLTGLGEVLMSWRQILKNASFKHISCDNVWVNLVDDIANVICIEHLDDVELIATNIFVLEEQTWKMIHHQAGPLNHDLEQYVDEAMLH
ncbi:MAG: nuclear transport factor 2 family protein [Gammaproteobacteria bacterium]|nr:nuclear transport factor 2 family protein [Gammaproteobacteria bacterium]